MNAREGAMHRGCCKRVPREKEGNPDRIPSTYGVSALGEFDISIKIREQSDASAIVGVVGWMAWPFY